MQEKIRKKWAGAYFTYTPSELFRGLSIIAGCIAFLLLAIAPFFGPLSQFWIVLWEAFLSVIVCLLFLIFSIIWINFDK